MIAQIDVVTPLIALLGGGTLTAAVVKVFERKRNKADLTLVDAQAEHLHVDSANNVIKILVAQGIRAEEMLKRSEEAVAGFRVEVARLHDQLTELQGVVSTLVDQLTELGVTPRAMPSHPPMPPFMP